MPQRHLGIILDNHLSRPVCSKKNKTVCLLCKLQCLFSRSALLPIQKTFVQPDLHYGDIYEKAYNLPVHQKIKYVQYNTCLAITGAIRGTSKEKLDDELGLESLQLYRWFRKLFYFYKLYKHESPQYLFKVIPLRQPAYATRNTENIEIKSNIVTFIDSIRPNN